MATRWSAFLSRSFVLAMLVSLPLAGPVSSASDVSPRDPTSEELERFRKNTHVDTSPESGTAVENFLFGRANEPPQSLAPSLSREFGLPLDAARHIVVGALILGVTWIEEGEELAADLEESGPHLLRAVAMAPGSWVAVEELARFYASGRRCRSAELIQLARDWGDLRGAALRLRKSVLGWSGCSEPLMTALGEHPNDLELIAPLAQQYREGPFGIAIRQYARDVLVYGFGIAPAVQVEIARSYIATLLTSGAATAAVEAFEALPEPLRERVWSEAAASHPVFPPGYREIAASDRSAFQIELAAAYLDVGNEERSRKWLASLAPEPRSDSDDSSESEAEDCVALLRAAIGETVADPYAFLLDVGSLEKNEEPSGCTHSRTWTRLIERLAAQTGYTEIRNYFALRDSPPLERRRFDAERKEQGYRFRTGPVGLRDAIDQVGRTLVEEKADADPAIWQTDEDRSPVSRSIHAAIPRHAQGPFVEHRLPDPIAPTGSLKREVEKTIDELDAERRTSPYWIWREERRGDTVVRVSVSQDYDPAGEVSAGGYSIHLSKDGGHTWQKPIYTGLRERFPYVVRRSSRLPILSGDTLQLEVAIDEVDTDSITFPPIGLAAKRQASGLFVSASLSDLMRDGDGDGLTDLEENALLTDPANPDTDGDRSRDGVDGLPHVARGSGDAERAAALAPALALMFGASFDARVMPIDPGRKDPASELRYAQGLRASLGDDHTLFVVGRRSDFGPLEVGHRIVVMTPREAGFAYQSRAVFYPTSISLFVLDRERNRGLILWEADWTGGRIRLTREQNGTWRADPISRWIT